MTKNKVGEASATSVEDTASEVEVEVVVITSAGALALSTIFANTEVKVRLTVGDRAGSTGPGVGSVVPTAHANMLANKKDTKAGIGACVC